MISTTGDSSDVMQPLPPGFVLASPEQVQWETYRLVLETNERTRQLMTTFDQFEQRLTTMEGLITQNNAATDELIQLVGELRTKMSPEEQARFDAIHARIGTLNTQLQEQLGETTAANAPTPPAPGPASAPNQPPQPGANPPSTMGGEPAGGGRR